MNKYSCALCRLLFHAFIHFLSVCFDYLQLCEIDLMNLFFSDHDIEAKRIATWYDRVRQYQIQSYDKLNDHVQWLHNL